MRSLSTLAFLLLAAAPLAAIEKFTVSTAPACAATDAYVYEVTDALNSKTCSTAGGSAKNTCVCSAGTVSVLDDNPEYDPLRAPSSCAVCDEFTDGTPSLTWDCAQDDDATQTYHDDAVFWDGTSASTNWKPCWTDPPSSGNVNFTITIAYTYDHSGGTGDDCGIAILSGGTAGSPTEVKWLVMANQATDGVYYKFDTDYSDVSGSGVHGSGLSALHTFFYNRNFLQIRYVDSTRVTTAYWSNEGVHWIALPSASATLTNDPIKIGLLVRRASECTFDFFRARTDDLDSAGQ